jgi:hypothetical protein
LYWVTYPFDQLRGGKKICNPNTKKGTKDAKDGTGERGSMGSIGWYSMKVEERWERLSHLLIRQFDVCISKTKTFRKSAVHIKPIYAVSSPWQIC